MKIKIFFCAIFLLLLSLINIKDINSFRLQQIGIFSWGSYNTIILDHSKDLITKYNIGDIFVYNNNLLPLKAPGLFIFGGYIYKFLLLFDLTYYNNYLFISTLMTVLLSLVPILLIVFLFYKLSFFYCNNKKLIVFTTLLLSMATMFLSYSGALIHDNLALLLLFLSFYLFKKQEYKFFIPFLLGFSIFFSYKIIILSILFLIYYLIKDKKYFFKYIVFYIIGLLPILIYQYIYFGNPLLTPHYVYTSNLDVFPKLLNFKEVLKKTNFYLFSLDTSIWINNLVLIPAFVGYFYAIKEKKNDFMFFLASSSAYLLYLLFIDTVGDCQYPPRYLIFFVPFLLLGIYYIYGKIKTIKSKIILLTIILWSILSNLIASMYPVMNCSYQNNIWQLILKELSVRRLGYLILDLPFIILLPVAFFLMIILLFEKNNNDKKSDSKI